MTDNDDPPSDEPTDEDSDELEREPESGQFPSDADVQAERQEEGVQAQIEHDA